MKFTFINKLFKLLCIALTLILVDQSSADETGGEHALPSSSVPTKLKRYHSALLKSPKRGRLFEKFCQTWIDLKSDKALAVFLKTSAENGGLADLKLLAFYQLRSGLDSEAKKTLTLAIEKFKDHPELIVELAKLEANSLNFDKATELLKQAQNTKLDDGGELQKDITKLLGKYLARAGKSDSAVVEWNKLVLSNPNDTEILEDVTQLLVSEGMFASALKVNQQLIDSAAAKKSPYKKIVYKLEKAEITKRSGNANEAVKNYEEILTEVESDSWIQKEILIRIAAIYVRGSKELGAFYERACDNHPNSVLFRKDYADHLASLGENDQAAERYLEIIKIRPQDTSLKEDFIDFLCSTNEHLKAKQMVEKLIGAEPTNQALYHKALVVYDHLNQRKSLLETLEKIDQITKQSETSALLHSQNLFKYRFNSEAKAYLENSIKRYPKTFQLRTTLANYYLKNSDETEQDKAIKLIRSAATHASKDQLMELTKILRSVRKNDIAYEIINERLESYKTDQQYLVHLSELALLVSKNQQAQDLAYAGLLLSTTNSDINYASDNFIKVIYKTKTIDSWLAKLSEKDSPGIPEMSLLAKLYWVTNANDQGQQIIDKLLLTRDVIAFTQVVKIYEHYKLTSQAIKTQKLLINLPNGVGKKLVHIRKIVTLYQNANMYKEALSQIKVWKSLTPNDKNAWLTHVNTLNTLDNKEEALNMLQKCAIKFPQDYDVSITLAKLYIEMGNMNKALSIYWKIYHEADKLDDKISIAMLLYKIYDGRGQVHLLVEKLDREIRLNPKSTHAHLCLAHLYEKTSSFAEQRRHLLAASNISPEDETIVIKIAKLDMEDNHLAGAEKALKKLIEKNSNAEALKLLSILYLTNENYDKASRLLVENNQLNNLDEILTFSVKLIQNDEFDSALKVLDSAPSRLRDHYKILYLKLLCYHQLNDYEKTLGVAIQINQLPDIAKVKVKVTPKSKGQRNPSVSIARRMTTNNNITTNTVITTTTNNNTITTVTNTTTINTATNTTTNNTTTNITPAYSYDSIPGYSIVSVFDKAETIVPFTLSAHQPRGTQGYSYQSNRAYKVNMLSARLASYDLSMVKALSFVHLFVIEKNLVKLERERWVEKTKDIDYIDLLRVIHHKSEFRKSVAGDPFGNKDYSPEFFEKVLQVKEDKDLAHAYILLPKNIRMIPKSFRDKVLESLPDKTSSIYKNYLFINYAEDENYSADVDELLDFMEQSKMSLNDYEIAFSNLQLQTREQQARGIVILEQIIDKPNLTSSQSWIFNSKINEAYAKTNAVKKALGRLVKLNAKTIQLQPLAPPNRLPRNAMSIHTMTWPYNSLKIDLSPVTFFDTVKLFRMKPSYTKNDMKSHIDIIKSPILQVHLLCAYELYSEAENIIIENTQGKVEELSLEWFKLKVALYGTHKKEYLKVIKFLEERIAITNTPALKRELSRYLVAYGYKYKLLHPKKTTPESWVKTLKSLKNITAHDYIIYDGYGIPEQFPLPKRVVKNQGRSNRGMRSYRNATIPSSSVVVNRKKRAVKKADIVKIEALVATGKLADIDAAIKLAVSILRSDYRSKISENINDVSYALNQNNKLLHKLCEEIKPTSNHFNECYHYYEIVEKIGSTLQKKQAINLIANSSHQNAVKMFKLALDLQSKNQLQSTLLFAKLPNRYTSQISMFLSTTALQSYYFKHRIAGIEVIKDVDMMTLCNYFMTEESKADYDPEVGKSESLLNLARLYIKNPATTENALRYILKFSPDLSDDEMLKLIVESINLKKTGLKLNRIPFQYRYKVVQDVASKSIKRAKSQRKQRAGFSKTVQKAQHFDSYLGPSALDHLIAIAIAKKDKSLINLEKLDLPKVDKELLENIFMMTFSDKFIVDFEKRYESEDFTDKQAYQYVSYIHLLNADLSNKILSFLAEKFIVLEDFNDDRQTKILLSVLPAIAENHAIHGKADQLKPAIARYLSTLNPSYDTAAAQLIQTLIGVPEYTLTLLEAGKKNPHITPSFDSGLITVYDPKKMINLLRAMGMLTNRENFPWLIRTAEESKALMAFTASHNKKMGSNYYSEQYTKRISASPLPLVMNTTPHDQANLQALLSIKGEEKFGATMIAAYRNSGLDFKTCVSCLDLIADDLEKLTPEQKNAMKVMFDFEMGLVKHPDTNHSKSVKALGVEPLEKKPIMEKQLLNHEDNF